MSTTSSVQSFIYQATGAVKEFLGFDSQAQIKDCCDRPYLNDITQRDRIKSLNANRTNETYLPVVGFPPNYDWSLKNHKFTTDFIRYPFLDQIRSSRSLRHIQTIDKSIYIPNKDFKFQSSKSNRPQLLSDIQSFNPKRLKSIPKSPSMFSQIKDVMSSAIGSVKEALGMETWPQGAKIHDQSYLNDIAQGRWKSLNKVNTVENNAPVVGFPEDYRIYDGLRFKINAPRRPLYLEQIRSGKKLRQVDGVVERTRLGSEFKDWRMSKPSNRQQLLLSIRAFDRSGLRRPSEKTIGSEAQLLLGKAKNFVTEQVDTAKEMLGMNTYPQRETKHTLPYLNEVASGKWEKLNHVSEVRESKPRISQEWREPVDRSVLLEEVQKGCELKHVQLVENNQLVVDPGYTVNQNTEERKALLGDIRGFENESLIHMGSS